MNWVGGQQLASFTFLAMSTVLNTLFNEHTNNLFLSFLCPYLSEDTKRNKTSCW